MLQGFRCNWAPPAYDLVCQRNREEYAGMYGAATAISEKMMFADSIRKTCTGADILLPAREAGFNRPFLILQSAVRLVVLLFICG